MIITQISTILINIIFGAFFKIIVFFLARFQRKNIFFYFALSFIITIILGLFYIILLEKYFFDFKLYYLLFIIIGFYIASSKLFNLKRIDLIVHFFIQKISIFSKIFFRFSLNIPMWQLLLKKLPKIKKKKIRNLSQKEKLW